MKRDVFAPLDPSARARHRAAYRRFLLERNGPFEARTGTFERREARLRQVLGAPVVASGPEVIDAAVFEAQYRRFDPRGSTSGALLLLLAIAKLDLGREPTGAHWWNLLVSLPDIDDTRLLVAAEEAHDARILNSTTRLFGVSPPGPRRLGRAMRAALSGVRRSPGFVLRPLRFTRRVLDVVSLLELLRVSSEILRGKPHLLEPLEERLLEVLIDRVGHVSFARTELDGAEIASARALLPAMTLALFEERREMNAIGAFAVFPSTEVVRFQLNDLLPEAVRRRAYLA